MTKRMTRVFFFQKYSMCLMHYFPKSRKKKIFFEEGGEGDTKNCDFVYAFTGSESFSLNYLSAADCSSYRFFRAERGKYPLINN